MRSYQLYLVDNGTSPASLNAAICGLKFFFGVTLDRPEAMAKMKPVHLPRKLPEIMSPDEVKRLIAAAGNLKHQTALALAYATGLRVNEVVHLKVSDIDSQRMTLRVEQGKGQKDRYALLSPVLLERLRVWWRVARAQGKMLDGGWLFPGLDPVDHLSTRQLNRAIHAAADEAGIDFFEHATLAVLAMRRFCILNADNFSGSYGPDLWGQGAADGPFPESGLAGEPGLRRPGREVPRSVG